MTSHPRTGLLCLSLCAATAANAECPQGQYDFNSCRIAGRNTEVSVCYDDDTVTYSYGPVGKPPELFLTEPIATVDFQPWHGVGKAIFESVTFYNGDYAYQVGGGFDRPFTEEEMEQGPQHFGLIDISKHGKSLATLECVPDTVSFGLGGGIFYLKDAAGYEWDDLALSWIDKKIKVSEPPLLISHQGANGPKDCLPASEFSLGGVTIYDTAMSLAKLGSPEATSATTPQGLPIDQITAHGLEIGLMDEAVIGITASTADWPTPSGLKIGLTRGEVVRILGHAPAGVYPADDQFTLPICPAVAGDPADWTAEIDFGQDRRVATISFLGPLP